MVKNIKNQPESHGVTTEIKEELVKLGKDIESGELGSKNLALNEVMTTDIAKALIAIGKAIEAGTITDEELAILLAKVLKRLSRGRTQSLMKKKKAPRTVFDLVLDRIIKVFAQKQLEQKRNRELTEPGSLVKNMINDLEAAITKLQNDPRLDSDVNDARLIEDVLAVSQKMAALSGRATGATRGVSGLMMSGMAASASVGGLKGIATLSTLKAGMATESWNEATKINYGQVSGLVSAESEQSESMQERMQRQSAKAQASYGPNDIPTTDAVKEFKQQKNAQWEQSAASLRKEGK